MLLPNADLAEIDPAKLPGYLLLGDHPLGRFKARFFTALGFSADRWEELGAALRAHLVTLPRQPFVEVADNDLVAVRPATRRDV